MHRRLLAGVLGIAAAGAGHVFAQDLPLVAMVVPLSAEQAAERLAAFKAGLREHGFIEGTHYMLVVRYADGVSQRVPGLVKEVGSLKPRVVVSGGIAPVVKQLLPETPHVFTGIAADPIKLGLGESYARPGGNTTGYVLTPGGGDGLLTQKRIQLFRQLVPQLSRLGFLGSTTNIVAVEELEALRNAASTLGFELLQYPIQTEDDIESAIAAATNDGVHGLYVSGEPRLISNLGRIANAIAAAGKPAMGTYPDFARAGLLMAYSADLVDGFRRVGIYVARILRGEKAGDLPIEQASKFHLVVNAITAKRLGITVPPTFLADEVIE